MNVTLKLPDELCRRAKHRAVDEDLSLSAWMAKLLEKALAEPERHRPSTLIHVLGDDSAGEAELELPERKRDVHRRIEFP